MKLTRWILPDQTRSGHGNDPESFLEDLLISRGLYEQKDRERFLQMEALSDPMDLPDMEKAVNRIHDAVMKHESIVVYGDYDCDGACASAILVKYLRSIGAEVRYLLPSRHCEGYGLHTSVIEQARAENVHLIVTVDNGIAAIEEAALAREYGIDLIVTDHHQPGETLPDALAVVDAYRLDAELSYRSYCGAGVAYQLVRGLNTLFDCPKELEEELLALAALATIGDIVPLNGENRTIVRLGLPLLQNGCNLGVRALMKATEIRSLSSKGVAFSLVPKLNAPGRIGDAELAPKLLLAETEERAAELAGECHRLNTRRQKLESEILASVLNTIDKDPSLLNERVLVLSGDDWDIGVIGIVCSRLLLRYGVPVFLMTEQNGMLTGSARGPESFSIFEALNASSEALERFGGHRQAGGYSLRPDEFDHFRSLLQEYAKSAPVSLEERHIDRILEPDDIQLKNAEILLRLEPYGTANPEPLFLLEDWTLGSLHPLSDGKHTKALFLKQGKSVEVLCFGIPTADFPAASGMQVSLLVRMETNEFRGRRSVSLRLEELRPAALKEEVYLEGAIRYRKAILREQSYPLSREEVILVYRAFRWIGRGPGNALILYFSRLYSKINYGSFLMAIEVLRELNLIRATPGNEEVQLVLQPEHTELNRSSFFRYLQEQ